MSLRTRLIRILLATVLATVALVGIGAPAARADDRYRITLDMSECGVMAVGVTGTCIVSLQTWLNIFDDANLKVDGVFGQATKHAVINFQLKHGLTPDGRFGEHARNALRGEYKYMIDNSVATPRLESTKCNTATGVNCPSPGIERGADGGVVQILFCAAVTRNVPAAVFCEIVLS